MPALDAQCLPQYWQSPRTSDAFASVASRSRLNLDKYWSVPRQFFASIHAPRKYYVHLVEHLKTVVVLVILFGLVLVDGCAQAKVLEARPRRTLVLDTNCSWRDSSQESDVEAPAPRHTIGVMAKYARYVSAEDPFRTVTSSCSTRPAEGSLSPDDMQIGEDKFLRSRTQKPYRDSLGHGWVSFLIVPARAPGSEP